MVVFVTLAKARAYPKKLKSRMDPRLRGDDEHMKPRENDRCCRSGFNPTRFPNPSTSPAVRHPRALVGHLVLLSVTLA
jgi:hypothetical protein